MSNEKFAKTPGSTCINNGGKNIRNRIEAIARFKKYPVGMSLVSVCAIIALVVSLVIGTKAMSVPELGRTDIMSLAKAKSAYCSTYAGAFDTYAKAVIKESRCYRIICAPENEQAELIESDEPLWDCGLSGTPDTSKNYRIYNIESPEENVYEGLLVIQLCNVPEGFDYVENQFYLAYQKIRVFKSQNRWLVTPVSEFRYTSTNDDYIGYGCNELPGKTYTDTVDDYKVDITFQTVYAVNNKLEIDNDEFFSMMDNSYHFNSTPILDAKFYEAYDSNEATLTHLGTQEERDRVKTIGISSVPVYAGQEMPGKLTPAIGNQNSSSSSSDGTGYSTMTTEPGWGPSKHFYGVGGGGTFSELLNITNPAYFVADLYINNELYSRLELHLQKEEQK